MHLTFVRFKTLRIKKEKDMDKKDIRIVFMGTPEFAVESLKALVEGGYNVVAVVTQPDKPVGRHQDTLQAPAVKVYAESVGLPVLQPIKMKDADFLAQLKSYHADLQVVVAFRMLPQEVWDMPRFGTFNVHAALLPQYRGAAPINWAVINGETETGVTTFFLDKDIDTGRIIQRKHFPIPDHANVEYVYDGLMKLGAVLATETIDFLAQNLLFDMSKEELTTAIESFTEIQNDSCELHDAPKIFKETCKINWQQPSKNIYNFIRGLSPYPGAWSNMVAINNEMKEKGKMVMKVFETAKTDMPSKGESGTFIVEGKSLYINTADRLLEIKELQLSGKKRIDSRSFLNGFQQIENYKLLSE